ncbi:MAG: ATP-binding protein, partial [Opitutaceae bacterium]
ASYPALLEAFSFKLGRKLTPIEDHGAWWDIESSAITNSLGHERGYLFVLRDTTALQSARLRADDLARKAHAANEAKSVFLAQVSHDLRTPMHAILGMTDLLKSTTLSADQEANANTIREAGEGLLQLINDLLDLSRIEAGKVDLANTAFQLDDVLDPVMDLMGVVARRKGLTLVHWIEPGLKGGMRGDPARLRQIVLNLVGNSVKFTTGGRVSVKASRDPRNDQALLLEIHDTGPGIPRESIPSLFKPFERGNLKVTRRNEGTGLGLAIVKRLVDSMKGRIEVLSTLGAGSTFTVSLPILDDSTTSHFFSYCSSQMSGIRVTLAMPETIRRTAVRMNIANMGATVVDWLPGTLAPDSEILVVEQADRNATPASTWRTLGRRVVILASNATKSIEDLVALKRRDLALALIGNDVAAGSAPATVPNAGNISALLADDDPLSCRVSAALLKHLGCAVTTVDNGKAALDLLEKQHFDLLILDGQMPEMNGWEVVHRLRKTDQPLPALIALSADLTPDAHSRWLKEGVFSILPKPASLATLGSVITALFETPADTPSKEESPPSSETDRKA